MKIYLPASFPFEYTNIQTLETEVSLDKMRENLSKHKGIKLKLKINIVKDKAKFSIGYLTNKQRKKYLNDDLLEFYSVGCGSSYYDHTIEIDSSDDIKKIASDYSCPSDIERDVYQNIAVFI